MKVLWHNKHTNYPRCFHLVWTNEDWGLPFRLGRNEYGRWEFAILGLCLMYFNPKPGLSLADTR